MRIANCDWMPPGERQHTTVRHGRTSGTAGTGGSKLPRSCRSAAARNPQSAFRNPRSSRCGFTLIELLIVLVVVGIAMALTLPSADSGDLKLQQAARLLAADIEFAQNESVAHPDDPRLIKVNTTNHTWWVGTASAPDTPVADPARPGSTMLVSPGAGRAAGLSGVTIASVSLGGDSELRFNAYGVPDQSSTASIVLRRGTPTLTVQIAPGSGEVTIP